MTAQYIKSAGPGERHFVNQDFVDAVGELYPATWEKIPLGWHVYTGRQGADEVLFTQHGPVGDLEGQVYEVNWPPVRPEAFLEDILPHIEHSTLKSTAPKMARQRMTWTDNLQEKWGTTLAQTLDQRKQAARVPSGLYGYTRAIQASCETSVRRLNKQAGTLVAKAVQKDPNVLDFLQVHARRAKSMTAKILLASYKDSMPKIAMETKTAKQYGMYGYPAKTASTGLMMCTALREAAGIIGSELHSRQTAKYAHITGFFTQHGKTAKCGACKLILSVYPEETMSFGKRASEEAPQTVEDWIAWEPTGD